MSLVPLQICLFGPFSATLFGEPLPRLRTRKGHRLLALLALRQDREVSREWLAGTLWPESEESQAYYNLRQCLTNLRHALGTAAGSLHAPTPHVLRLSSEHVESDVRAYEALIAEGSPSALERAVTLYRGPLMEGCLEECFILERAAHEQTYLAALETLARLASERNDPSAAVRYLRLLLAADPFREAACGALMAALAQCGDHAAVNRVYRDLRLLLQRELNAAPASETETLYRNLVERSKQPSPLFAGPGWEGAPPSRRLPVPLTRLIGRQQEAAAIAAYVKTNRLVTLTGAGGIGKTRLALAVGEALTTQDVEGVWFVELAALSEPERVPQAVAKALGITEKAGQSLLDTLVEALASRPFVLILDNAEHLLSACALLTDRLLSYCPRLQILVTSRQPLGLMGEQLYSVPSLSLPPANAGEKSEEINRLLQYASVQLFMERAAQWKAGFGLTRQNAAAILQICHRLDGIPLAIELAAARLRSLSVEEIDAQLQNCFALLTGGNRTALPRHQTLRALIDWSHDLLTEPERTLLSHLSVFAGGWTLEQAQYVCEEDGQGYPVSRELNETAPTQPVSALVSPSPVLTVLEGLTSLLDKSLVVAEEREGTTRYRMLETVRQYANEKLRQRGAWQMVSRRHCDCFLAVAAEAGAPVNRALHGQWLDLLENEYDNLRAALIWCHEEPEEGQRETRLTLALYTFWHLRGYLREGRDCLLHAAARAAQRDDIALQAQLLQKAGALARLQGDFTDVEAILNQALMLAKMAGEATLEAYSLLLLGSVALTQGVAAEGVTLIEQALSVARRIGHHGVESECLVWLGDAARWRGDYAAAQAFYEAGLDAARPLRMGWFEAIAFGMMADLALRQGEVLRASSLARRALQGYIEAGDKTYCVLILDTLAGIALAQGRPDHAALLLAFVDVRTDALQTPLPLPERETHLRRLGEARRMLDAGALEAASASGRRMRWEEAIACALEESNAGTI